MREIDLGAVLSACWPVARQTLGSIQSAQEIAVARLAAELVQLAREHLAGVIA